MSRVSELRSLTIALDARTTEKEENESERLEKLCNCIDRLPPENKPIFGRLWALLGAVVDHAANNKMNAHHLSYVQTL
jgi:hypothetical protein